MNTVAVIGGGASGLMAAITAAKNGAQVYLIEQKDKVGKKILSTGNGRCNFTNLQQEPFCYRCESPQFPWTIIEQFDAMKTIAFFLELGIYSKNRNGYLYPHSDQASSVLDAMLMEAKKQQVHIKTDSRCLEIQSTKRGFHVVTGADILKADTVIVAAGSKAAPVTGSDGSGYTIAKQMGHHLIPVLPSLVQLRCHETFYKALAGVRVNGKVSLFLDGECMATDTGEIQLTNYGISGIPVFQISRYASIGLYQKQDVTASINFMPDFTEEQFLTFIKKRISTRPGKTVSEFFVGLFHDKLSQVWIKLLAMKKEQKVDGLSEKEIHKLCHLIQNFVTEVKETNSFEQAQVCRGGVDTDEITAQLESRFVKGLYFAGEILDVDGLCGGYNLQWAWSSGYVAGREAAHASS